MLGPLTSLLFCPPILSFCITCSCGQSLLVFCTLQTTPAFKFWWKWSLWIKIIFADFLSSLRKKNGWIDRIMFIPEVPLFSVDSDCLHGFTETNNDKYKPICYYKCDFWLSIFIINLELRAEKVTYKIKCKHYKPWQCKNCYILGTYF